MTIQVFHPNVAFTDERGDITNLLEAPIQHITLITCKKGAVRANHIHSADSHYTYMLSGSMQYYEKTGSSKSDTTDNIFVGKGDVVYTPSQHPHAMVFLEDSVFIAFTTHVRDNGAYQEDTQPFKVV